MNHILIDGLIIGNRRDFLLGRPLRIVCPRFARTEDNKLNPAKHSECLATRLVDALPEALPFVSISCFWIVQDRLYRWAFGSIKEIVNIDHVDPGSGADSAQKLLCENHVLEVTEPKEVIPSRSCREPIGRRGRGECDLNAATPEKQHIRVPSKVLHGRF